jgi:nuclear polyadenylated RNA-binding protein 3
MLDGMPIAIGAPLSATQDDGSSKVLSLEQDGRLSQGTTDTRPSESHVEPTLQAPLEFRDSAVNRPSSTPATEHSTLNPESVGHHQDSAQPSFPTDPLNSHETSLGALQTDAAAQASPSLPDGGLPPGTVNLQAFLDSYSARNQENTKAESSAYYVSDPGNAHTPNGDGKDSTKPPPSIPLQNVASLPNVPFIPAASMSHPLPNIPPPLTSRRGHPASHASAPIASARDDGAFTPEMEQAFEEFLRDESVNVSEGSWEKFPDGSRLFIGERWAHAMFRHG